jgi:hypothetical protein
VRRLFDCRLKELGASESVIDRMGDDLIAVHWVDGGIAVSVNDNGRNGSSDPARCSRKIGPAHSCEGRRYVAGGAHANPEWTPGSAARQFLQWSPIMR